MEARAAHTEITIERPLDDHGIVEMILLHEGGTFTNHPNDRGGPTKWGITLFVLSKYRQKAVTIDDVRNLTRTEAENIYLVNFVKPFYLLGETVLRANVIDMSVNAGIKRGVILLQQIVGAKVDGVFGPATAEASLARDWNPLYVGMRLAFYERIIERDGSQLIWRNGWRNRALSFYGKAHRMPLRMQLEPVFGHSAKAFTDD